MEENINMQIPSNLIESLIKLKFPVLFETEFVQRQIYNQELADLSHDELKQLYMEQAEIADAELFSTGNIDFSFWARADYWDINEAIALIMNIEPNSEPHSHAYDERSSFLPTALKFRKISNFMDRAIKANQLSESATPLEYLDWAKRMNFTPPKKLIEMVNAKDSKYKDWQTEYEALQQKYTDLEKQLITEQTIAHHKSKRSALIMILAMATKHYQYDPKLSKNHATTKIVASADRIGLKINDATVVTWLRDAADVLDGEYELPKK